MDSPVVDIRRLPQGATILVVGLGRSGMAALAFLHSQGFAVKASSMGTRQDIPAENLSWFTKHGVELEMGSHDDAAFQTADLLVTSPGVPPDIPALARARHNKRPIIGETALAMQYAQAPVVGVTGTNGKSTVTTLLGNILEAAGKKVFVGGNLGVPLFECLLHGGAFDFFVLELSSFQLETFPLSAGLRCAVAVLLNISPDHLDRHGSLDEYARIKLNIFHGMHPNDSAILNADDRDILRRAGLVSGKKHFFSRLAEHPMADGRCNGSSILLRQQDGSLLELDLAGSSCARQPNLVNACAAALAARACGVQTQDILAGIGSFVPLGHRMALVAERSGVSWFDDSKATNIGAVASALDSLTQPVVLIAGGRDKGGDYDLLHSHLKGKVKAALLLGEAAGKMAASLGTVIVVEIVDGMTQAVARADALARPGDAVLLAPACASFDMFSGYQERGRVFCQAVQGLVEADQ